MRRVVVPVSGRQLVDGQAPAARLHLTSMTYIHVTSNTSCQVTRSTDDRQRTRTKRGASDGTEPRCGGFDVRAGASGRGTSKDALLYALGVGAGALDPTGFELDLTTENSDGVTQRVLPTFTTIVGQGGGGRAVHRRLRPGHARPRRAVHPAARRDPDRGDRVDHRRRSPACTTRASAGLVVLESESRHAGSGEPAFTNRTALFIRGAGGFGGPAQPRGRRPRARWPPSRCPAREPDEVVTYADPSGSGAALPAERGPQPAALGPDVRQAGRLRPPDPARTVHLRLHRARPAPRGVRLRPGALRRHAGPLLQADHARRHADRSRCGTSATECRGRLPVPHRDPARRDGDRRRAVQRLAADSGRDCVRPRQSAHTPKISTVWVTSL